MQPVAHVHSPSETTNQHRAALCQTYSASRLQHPLASETHQLCLSSAGMCDHEE